MNTKTESFLPPDQYTHTEDWWHFHKGIFLLKEGALKKLPRCSIIAM